MTVKEIIKMLTSEGWQLKATKGSHLQYVHPFKPGKVTLPYHKGGPAPKYFQQRHEAGRAEVALPERGN